MGGFDDYKPAMAMIGIQSGYAAMSLLTRTVVLQGMNPRVFVVYRQAMATLVIAPLAFFSRCAYVHTYTYIQLALHACHDVNMHTL